MRKFSLHTVALAAAVVAGPAQASVLTGGLLDVGADRAALDCNGTEPGYVSLRIGDRGWHACRSPRF